MSKKIGLGKYFVISQQIESLNGRNLEKIHEDVFEAFLGALFLSNGFEPCCLLLVNLALLSMIGWALWKTEKNISSQSDMIVLGLLGIFAVSQRVCQELLIKGPRYVSGHYWPQTGPGTRNFQLRKNGVFWGNSNFIHFWRTRVRAHTFRCQKCIRQSL